MKQLFLILAMLCLSIGAYAQTEVAAESVPDTSRVLLQRRLGHLRMDKTKLTDPEKVWILSNINGVDYNAEWDHYRGNRNVGAGLVIGGYSIAALSGSVAFVYMLAGVFGGAFAAVLSGGDEEATQNATKDVFNTAGKYGAVALGAAAIGSAGLPLLIVNGRKMSKIVNEYNSATEYNTLPIPESEQQKLTISLIPASRPSMPGISGQGGYFFGVGVGINF